MKKYKRSQEKRITIECKIIRYMRISQKLSMREAGRRIGVSDTLISHFEHGRANIHPRKLETLIAVYGFSQQQFQEFLDGKPIPILNMKNECVLLLEKMDDNKLRAVHGLLLSFAN